MPAQADELTCDFSSRSRVPDDSSRRASSAHRTVVDLVRERPKVLR